MKEKCGLCKAEIGPDITGRPMCYGCGPVEMLPAYRYALLTERERLRRQVKMVPA